MELDLSGHRSLLLSLAIFLLLLILGWLGYAYLPSGDKFLTRSEWQFHQASQAYQKELSQLRAAAETLADSLNGRPDPVRAQLVAESIQRLASQGQPALEYPRGKLIDAAQAVSDWAVGAIDRDSARQALEEAFQMLFPEDLPLPTPLSSGSPADENRRR